jgi:four helix bundle protein
MAIQAFEDLQVWKEARRLTQEIYRLTRAGTFSKDFSLTNRMQRAAISIISNIAEGYERGGIRIFLNSCTSLKAPAVSCELNFI